MLTADQDPSILSTRRDVSERALYESINWSCALLFKINGAMLPMTAGRPDGCGASLRVAALLAVRRRRYWEAALALGALIVGQLIRYGISVLVGRARPPPADWLTSASGYAFPSGHSTNAVLAWGLCVAVLWPWLAQRRHRATATGVAIVVALIAGATRAYLGVHWPADVLGGWALGCALLTLSVSALSVLRFHSPPTPQYRLGQRPSTEQPAPPEQ